MELYGSLLNISGSVTASTFTGSFIGDGSGLTGIQASGVEGLNLSQIATGSVTASLSPNGFNVNSNTSITGSLRVSGNITAEQYNVTIISSSVLFQSGSSKLGDTLDDIHQLTGSVEITGSISLNGQLIGTGKLDETTFQSYTSSNDDRVSELETSSVSLNSFTSSINTTIKSKLDSDGVISGSGQVNITGTTGYSTFSSSISTSIDSLSSSIDILSSSVATTTSGLTTTITNLSSSIATTDLNQSNRLISIENKTGSYATTGSNLFIGTQTHSGSILPSVDNAYDLGSEQYQWRDVYISSGSLYIDGTKVISSTAQELVITTDNGQSIKILEGTTDSIILQTADGDIELKSSADGDILLDPTNGKILLKGPIEVLSGQKIQSSVGGTPVVFANDIVVSGSIDITGTIEGINLTDFSSSVNGRLVNLETSTGSLNSFTSSTNTRLTSLETTTSSLNSYSSSANTKFVSIESVTSSFNTYSGTTNERLVSIESSTGSLNSFTSSTNIRLNSIETNTSSLNTFTSSIDTTIKNKLNSDGVISGSIQVDLTQVTGYNLFSSSLAITDLSQNSRLTSVENKTGSYATTGSNSFIGNQTITGSLTITQNLLVLGSSSLLVVTSSQLALSSSVISVNVFEPAERFGGLKVYDSGSESHLATASLLWDSLNNHWIYQNASGSSYSGGMLLSGPRNTGSLGDELGLTSGKIPRSVGGDHLDNSIISQVSGNAIGISGSLVVTGSILSTITTLISGSSQIDHNATTNYAANQHIDHTTVSITAGNGLSGGGAIDSTKTISLDTASATFTSGVKAKMNTDGVVSGSSQVSFNGITDKPTLVSGSAQVSFNTITDKPALVSGSSQITYGSLTGIPANIVSGSSQVSYPSLSNIPSGIVSGSSQISYPSLSNIPGGIVSGSAQVDLTSTTNYSTGIKTRLNAEGVISGSAQLTSAFVQKSGDTMTGALTAAGVTSTAGVTVSGTGYYTFNKPSTASYQTVSLFGTTSGGLFLTSDNAIISKGAYFNGSWIATSAAGSLIDFTANSSQPGIATFSGATIGGAATFTTTQPIWHAGNLTNLNQLTNGPGYITGISFANVSSKPTTISGYGITDAITTGNIGSQSVSNAATVASITPAQFFNNMGNIHATRTAFDASTPSYDFGIRYVQGTTNGPGTGGSQYYSWYLGLGSDYPATGAGSYGAMFAVDRNVTTPYLSVRYNENNSFSSWRKIHAGYADSAGSLTSMNISQFTNNSGYLTSLTDTLATVTSRGSITTALVTLSKTNSTLYNANSYNGGTGQLSITSTINSTGVYNGIRFAGGSGSHEGFFGTVQNSSGLAEFIFQTFNGTSYGERTRITSRGSLLHGHAVAPSEDAWLSTAVFGRDSYNKVIIGSLNSTTTGAYIGGHNSALNAWADINVAGEAIIFRYQQTERARFDTSGHFIPGVNGTYNMGSSSLRWGTVFTSDLSLSNGIGDYTIVEGEEKLYLYNNKNSKVYSFVLQEEDPTTATPKKS